MKKPGFKFFILRRLARLLRRWANLASKLSGMEDQLSFSAATEEPPKPVKARESTETAGPPAHWLARIEAGRQPAHWLSHVSAKKPATQKSQERQNLQEPQSQKGYINLESRASSYLAPPDDKELATDQSAHVTENTQAEEAVNRQATINSDRSEAEHIVMNRQVPITEKNTRQRWEQGEVFVPISQSSTSAPRDWPSLPTTPDPSFRQEKVALPFIPKIDQNSRPQNQKSEQTVLSSRSLPENITSNRTIADQDQIVEQPGNRESVILQDQTVLDDNVHRWPQKRIPEQVGQTDQPPLPPAASLVSQVVQIDSPSQEARSNRQTTLAGEPVLWAQTRPAEPVPLSPSWNRAAVPPQATMHWPALPEDSTLNMTSDSQDLTLMRRNWERQQRLNEEQRGNLWNA